MSLYSLPVLIGSIFSLIAGCLIYSANRKSQNNISFSLFCFSLFVWLFGYVIAYSVKDEQIALFFCRIACTGAMFTAPSFYHFAVSFLERRNEFKLVVAAYLSMLFIVPFSATSDLFLRGVYKYYWGYYSKAGLLHPVYLIIFFGIFLRGFYILLVENWKKNPNPAKRVQINYIFVAYAVALLGAIDYVPKYGVQIFPFGFLFEILFIIIVAYAIIAYRLMDIRIAIARTAILLVTYSAIFAATIILSTVFKDGLVRIFDGRWWVVPAIIYTIGLTAAPFVYQRLQMTAENEILRHQRHNHSVITSVAQSITLVRDLDKLLKITVRILTRTLGITHASVFLLDRSTRQYCFSVTRGGQRNEIRIDSSNSLVKYLQGVRKPIVYEEVKRQYDDRRDIFIKEIRDTMNRLSAELLVPSYIENELVGFFALGAKKSGEMYSNDDLGVLSNLADQSALAIENAQFLKEREEMQAKLREAEKLIGVGEMLGAVRHEMGNLLNKIAGTTQMMEVLYDKLDKPKFSEMNRKAVRDMMFAKTIWGYVDDYKTKSKTEEMALYNVKDCVEKAIGHSKQNLDDWKISVSAGIPSNIVINGKQVLPEIFKHLMINACYGMETTGGEITYSCRILPDRGTVEVLQKNTGTDLSAEINNHNTMGGHLFAEQGKLGGINLFIARLIVKDHKGSFEIRSDEGKGTVFAINLPIDFTSV